MFKRTPIWIPFRRKIMRRSRIPKYSLKTLIWRKVMQNDISVTQLYETWISSQPFETQARKTPQMCSKDQITRLCELKSIPITGGVSTTWNGTLLTTRHVRWWWTCQGTIETLWHSTLRRYTSVATRRNWPSTQWTSSPFVPSQTDPS